MDKDPVIHCAQYRATPQDVSKLISKLRWIGMDDEAHHLQAAVATLPPDARGTTAAEPLSTD
jgi:hypothetical protein